MLTPDQLRACQDNPAGPFFDIVDEALVAIDPKVGQWFCEFDIRDTLDGEEVQDGAIVEYLGSETSYILQGSNWVDRIDAIVCEEDGDPRRPSGLILILQG